MTSSVIPARLEFQCGHAALVSLPRIKGETSAQRNERIAREKVAAQARACDFCGPDVAIVVRAAEPEPVVAESVGEVAAETLADLEAVAEVAALVAGGEEEAIAIEAALEEEAIAIEAALEEEAATAGVEVEEPVVVVVEEEPVVIIEEEPVTVFVEESPEKRAPRRAPTKSAVAQELRQYTVRYRVERVIAATDISDALRRAGELGATDVLAITRA